MQIDKDFQSNNCEHELWPSVWTTSEVCRLTAGPREAAQGGGCWLDASVDKEDEDSEWATAAGEAPTFFNWGEGQGATPGETAEFHSAGTLDTSHNPAVALGSRN